MEEQQQIAIAVRELSKTYHLKDDHSEYSSNEKESKKNSTFHALDNLSFDLMRGEVLGIIGKNGSGKTTLLRILSGITRPDSGEALIYGQALSILDIGSNFHPDLSGYENILMQLRIRNIPKEKFPELIRNIREFSEIGRYIDQPVKYYSNGMFMRLAFSIVLNLSADIMILDEVFSVGDEAFRIKCRSIVKEFTRQGKTMMLVSHNREEITELCDRCLWLEKGAIKQIGPPVQVMAAYFEEQEETYQKQSIPVSQQGEGASIDDGYEKIWSDQSMGNDILAVKSVKISSNGQIHKLYTNADIVVSLTIEKKRAAETLSAMLLLKDTFHQPVLAAQIFNNKEGIDYLHAYKDEVGVFDLQCIIPAMSLASGAYYISIRFGRDAQIGVENSPEAFTIPSEIRFKISDHPDHFDFIGKSMNCALRPTLSWSYTKKT